MKKITFKTQEGRDFIVNFDWPSVLEIKIAQETISEFDVGNIQKLSEEITQALAWAKQGSLTVIEKELIVKFDSRATVIRAIQMLHLEHVENKKLVLKNQNDERAWKELVRLYQRLLDKKIKNANPPKLMLPHDRLVKANTTFKPRQSANKAEIVNKLPKQGRRQSQDNYFYKNAENEVYKISEIESAIAAYYRAYLGYNRAPKAKPVFEGNIRKGISLKGIEGFKSFFDYLKDEYQLKTHKDPEIDCEDFYSFLATFDYQPLVNQNLIELLVGSYVFEEADLHCDNWGFDCRGESIRIDFDRSIWPLTSKFAGFPEATKSEEHDKRPRDAFPITAEEIRVFPFLINTKPDNWVFLTTMMQEAKKHGFDFQAKLINDLKKHPDFERRKWTAFLKALLMPAELFENISADYIGAEKSAQKYSQHIVDRLETLRGILLKMPEFQAFILEQGDAAYKHILNDISEYNSKEKHPRFQYDCVKVNDEYAKIVAVVTAKNKLKENILKNKQEQKQASKKNSLGNTTTLFRQQSTIKRIAASVRVLKPH